MKRLIRAIALSLVLSASLSAPAYAWNPFGGVDCPGKSAAVQSSAVCSDGGRTTNPITGSGGLAMKIVNVMAIIGGIAAVIFIVLAGLRMVTSAGSSEDVAGARRTIIYAAVGLVVIALARIIVGYVISKI